jgi:hypothetical protein
MIAVVLEGAAMRKTTPTPITQQKCAEMKGNHATQAKGLGRELIAPFLLLAVARRKLVSPLSLAELSLIDRHRTALRRSDQCSALQHALAHVIVIFVLDSDASEG